MEDNQNKKEMYGAIATTVLSLLNTGISLVKDKKAKAKENTELLNEAPADGVSISSKRVMNLGGTVTLIGFGMSLVSEGKTWEGLACIGLGVIYSVGLSYVTHISEKE